jgi:hypothetical protein
LLIEEEKEALNDELEGGAAHVLIIEIARGDGALFPTTEKAFGTRGSRRGRSWGGVN